MTIRPVTHERLMGVVTRWRHAQRVAEDHRFDPPRATPMSEVYRHCANDLELALRDDETIQPRKRK